MKNSTAELSISRRKKEIRKEIKAFSEEVAELKQYFHREKTATEFNKFYRNRKRSLEWWITLLQNMVFIGEINLDSREGVFFYQVK